MAKKRQIYINGKLPDGLTQLLLDSNVPVLRDGPGKEDSMFSFGERTSNINLSPADWEKVKSSPIAFIDPTISDWDLPQLMLKRFFGGEGALGPEESYKGVIQKANTIKLLELNCIGYYSDVIASFASEVRVNPTQIRNFSVLLLSYLAYLAKEEIVSLPIDIDYGVSQDGFFLQIHCDHENFLLENFVESANPISDFKNPFSSLITEGLSKVDLLEIYTIEASEKLVFNACWVHNPNFVRNDYYATLLIHQVRHLGISKSKMGSSLSPKSYFDADLKDISKVRVVEKLPTKLDERNNLKEVVNPVLVKRIIKFLNEKHALASIDISKENYNLSRLEKDISDFPDVEALERLNDSEKDEIIKALIGGVEQFFEKADEVKEKIDESDYLDGLLSSIATMTVEEVHVAVGGDEDLTEESQMVKGEREDLTEENQMVKGEREDLTEESQLVKGSQEEKAESLVIKGKKEEIKEERQIIRGTKEVLDKDGWNLKRQKVVEKVQGKINDLRGRKASHEEIDLEVKKIIVGELGVSEKQGEHFMSSLSDNVTDDWLKEGIDPVNENIKQRVKIEKMENQLGLREIQVEKMKKLLTSLKTELASARQALNEKKQFGSDFKNPMQENLVRESNQDPNEKENEYFPGGIPDLQVPEPRLDPSFFSEESLLENDGDLQDVIDIQKEEIRALKAKNLENERVHEKVENEVHKLREENKTLLRKFNESKDVALEISQEIEEDSSVEKALKAKSAEDDREIQKLRNDLHKVTAENEVLHRKLKEGSAEMATFKDSGEDASTLLKENENLKTQVESLKKRMSFMYENNKANKEISIGANDVQKIIEDKERFFAEKLKAQKEIENLKAELRESERILKQRDLELKEKDNLLKGKPSGGEEDQVRTLEKEVTQYRADINKLNTELKAAQIKSKSFEQKVKFMSAQLDKSKTSAIPGHGRSGGGADPKVAAKLKQVEIVNVRLKEAGEKLQKELTDKKAELHKSKMESKALEIKLKDLEKKLSQIEKKNAA